MGRSTGEGKGPRGGVRKDNGGGKGRWKGKGRGDGRLSGGGAECQGERTIER